MRLAMLGLSHESNTFAADQVEVAILEAELLRGYEIIRRHGGADTILTGFLSAGTGEVDVVPLVYTEVTPMGPLTREAVDFFVDEATRALKDRGPWDGILLSLHGAAVAEHLTDVDGYLLNIVRSVVGEIPIGVCLDLHANISPAMVLRSDVLATYRTNPHVDARERGAEVADLIIRTIRGEVHPTQALVEVPAIIDILRQNTSVPPMSDLITELEATLTEPGVLTASVAEGYPYADTPDMGMSVVVVTDADQIAAQRHAGRLAEKVWAARHDFVGRAVTVDDALLRAAGGAGTTLLLDVGDNIGGGSGGDSVVLLAAAQRLGVSDLVCVIADSDAAAACHRAGVGETLTVRLGGRTEPAAGPPLTVTGTVRFMDSGRYEDAGPTHSGERYFDAGPTAVLDLDGGQTIVVTSRALTAGSAAQLTSSGLDPAAFSVIVAKGVHSPLASYGPFATEIILVDTPGVTAANLRRFTYRHRRRPLFPFEPEAEFAIDHTTGPENRALHSV